MIANCSSEALRNEFDVVATRCQYIDVLIIVEIDEEAEREDVTVATHDLRRY